MNYSFSNAGIWTPYLETDLTKAFNGNISHGFYSLIKLKELNNYGIVLTGWDYIGKSDGISHNKIQIALLAPNKDGTLSVRTKDYIEDPITNGSGSVIIADFNKDGTDDIFLAA